MRTSRMIFADVRNNKLDETVITDDESAYVIHKTTRTALLKVLGNISPDDYRAIHKLTDAEAETLHHLYYTLQ